MSNVVIDPDTSSDPVISVFPPTYSAESPFEVNAFVTVFPVFIDNDPPIKLL